MVGRYIPLLILLFGCTTSVSTTVFAGEAEGAEDAEETEKLMLEVPAEWVQVVDRTVGNLAIAEYYPGDTTDDWLQKITVEALSGEGLPDPLVYAEGLADEQSDVCNRFSANPVFAGFENGYPTVVHLMECGQSKRTGKALLTMLKVILGNKALYTITRIWRLEPAALAVLPDSHEANSDGANPATAKAEPVPIEPLPIDQAELAAWSHTLSKVKVCDTALQAHPCATSDPDTDTEKAD